MTSTMNYEYMPGIDDSAMNGYGQESNNDLDQFFNFPQADGSNYPLQGGLFTPNGVNINGGMMQGPYAEKSLFQFSPNHGLIQYEPNSMEFPFPQEVNPATIMGPSQPLNGFQSSEGSQSVSNDQEQASDMAHSQGSELPVKRSAESEGVDIPKPKRTRRSKKKKLTPEQEERKRKEFLERNRQAASKCRLRKQEATSALQAKAQEYSLWNSQLKENAHALELEVAELKALLFSHPKCDDPEIARAIEFYKSMKPNGSVLGDTLKSGPATPSFEMQRSDSWMSARSDDTHNPDGSLNKFSRFLTRDMLREASKSQKAEQEAYMKEYTKQRKEESMAMSRQNSRESDSSSEATSSPTDASGYTSAITTPETSTKENICSMMTSMATRRGMPLKSFENPRCETTIDPSLPGVGPTEFLAQEEQ